MQKFLSVHQVYRPVSQKTVARIFRPSETENSALRSKKYGSFNTSSKTILSLNTKKSSGGQGKHELHGYEL